MAQSTHGTPFKRVISASASQHSPQVDICYQPEGFWSADVIRVTIKYVTTGKSQPLQSLVVAPGSANFDYSIKTSGGGKDGKLGDLDLTANYIAALQDAREMVLQAQSMAESYVPFLRLAEFFLSIGMNRDSVSPPAKDKALLLVLSDGLVILDGEFWSDEAVARNSVTPEQRAIEVRQATEVENTYWYYNFHAYHRSVYGEEK